MNRIRGRHGAATVIAVALVCLLLVLVASLLVASHWDGGHGTVFFAAPVFLFGLLAFEASLLPPGCWSEARLPDEPVRHSLRQRPPPLD